MAREVVVAELFESWKNQARESLKNSIEPEEVSFQSLGDTQLSIGFGEALKRVKEKRNTTEYNFKISRSVLSFLKYISCNKSESRWKQMYTLVYRINNGERDLLEDPSDSLTNSLKLMHQQVRRDRHKMTAFVRFRETPDRRYFAFYRPEHYITELSSSFFKKRFGEMDWTIATPHRTARWFNSNLSFSAGLPEDPFEGKDNFEDLWCDYYASIFNPARVKVSAMKNEMPTKYWSTMPETKLISKLIYDAPARVNAMQSKRVSAARLPVLTSLSGLHSALQSCDACDLAKLGTKVVSGEGSAEAKIMLIGEQPGDNEDRQGKCFVGPAGQLLNSILESVGINRSEIYLTNAVKHFNHTLRGELRLHARPKGAHINCCKPWMEKEIELLKPKVIVLMGTTAAQSVLGKRVPIKDLLFKTLKRYKALCFVTYHPSAILRAATDEKKNELTQIVQQTLQLAEKMAKEEKMEV